MSNNDVHRRDHDDPGQGSRLEHQHFVMNAEVLETITDVPKTVEAESRLSLERLEMALLGPVSQHTVLNNDRQTYSSLFYLTTSHSGSFYERQPDKATILKDAYSCCFYPPERILETMNEMYKLGRWTGANIFRDLDRGMKVQEWSGYGATKLRQWELQGKPIHRSNFDGLRRLQKHESAYDEIARSGLPSNHLIIDARLGGLPNEERQDKITADFYEDLYQQTGMNPLGGLRVFPAVDLTEPGWSFGQNTLAYNKDAQVMGHVTGHYFYETNPRRPNPNVRIDAWSAPHIDGHRGLTLAAVMEVLQKHFNVTDWQAILAERVSRGQGGTRNKFYELTGYGADRKTEMELLRPARPDFSRLQSHEHAVMSV